MSKKIDITDRLDDFRSYLGVQQRIIFSAPFGDGKTYFMKKFAELCEEEYYVVRLRPVNYSVASNEDVFEYIKRDILFMLHEDGYLNDIDLAAAFSSVLTWDNVSKAVDFLLSFSTHGELIKKLKTYSKNTFENYQSKKTTYKKYNEYFASQRGGLYEEDGYTALIREALKYIGQQHENKEGKKTLLFIDDLDRIDPAHMFRILNVISAHIDEDTNTNKFGFDNIVVAMDYNASREIFHHFYGADANYEGYMSKFLSSQPFYYSITEIARENLRKYINLLLVAYAKVENFRNLNRRISKLSLRDCEKISEACINKKFFNETYKTEDGLIFSKKYPFYKLLLILETLGMTAQEVAHDICDQNMKLENLIKFTAPLLALKNKRMGYRLDDNKSYTFDRKVEVSVINNGSDLEVSFCAGYPDNSFEINYDTMANLLNECSNKLSSFMAIGSWQNENNKNV